MVAMAVAVMAMVTVMVTVMVTAQGNVRVEKSELSSKQRNSRVGEVVMQTRV